MLTAEEKLDHACAIADAHLVVAESFGWMVAVLAAACIYLKWESAWIALPAGIASYVILTHPYRKGHDKAWKAREDYQPPPNDYS
ncbi:hypothetical protein D3C85_1598020 [compost metagenome]